MLAKGTERNKDRSEERWLICRKSGSIKKGSKKIVTLRKGYYYLVKDWWLFSKNDNIRINLKYFRKEIIRKFFCLVKGNKRKRRIG